MNLRATSQPRWDVGAAAGAAADYARVFATVAGGKAAPEALCVPGWDEAHWRRLLAYTEVVTIRARAVVIQRGDADHGLLFVAAGQLEVSAASGDGMTMSPLVEVNPGSVVGEMAFFDHQPRSASVWAVTDSVLLRLSGEGYARLGAAEPALARDLLFGLGRVLAARLRRATSRRG